MKLRFLGAAHEVTGSCTLLEAGEYKILVDCGMEQGIDTYENCEIPVLPADIDCVLLTHAHIDHSGKVPMLVAQGFQGPIYCTGATRVLCNMMLKDSAHIQESEAEWKNRKAERSGGAQYVPLYTMQDVEAAMPLFVPCEYEKSYQILEHVKLRFIDAGHLLGSASIEITATENDVTKTIVFSGDIGNTDRPLIRDPKRPQKADYIVMESTYGNRVHGERKDYVGQLTEVIESTLYKGGNVVIPSFAIGRTQELLYLIHKIKNEGLIKTNPNFPVWIDSPLAIQSTQIYNSGLYDYYDEEMLDLLEKGIDVLNFSNLHFSVTSDDSIAINNDTTPKVIISASGMCEAGRIRHHLKHNLWKANSTVLFVGYQAEGTIGRKLIDGATSVKLFNEEIKVNARIAQMDGISGHADMNLLLDWLSDLPKAPDKVFINHGSDTVCDEFANTVYEKYGYSAVAPYSGGEYDLITGECITEGIKVKIDKSAKRSSATTTVFERLLMAGKRLMAVIERNRGSSNKDNAKFADQINELCNKWDR